MSNAEKHDRQFKLDAVRMITDGGHTVAAVSRELGVGCSQLQCWNREFEEKAEHAFPGKGRSSTEDKELEDLRLRIALLHDPGPPFRMAISWNKKTFGMDQESGFVTNLLCGCI